MCFCSFYALVYVIQMFPPVSVFDRNKVPGVVFFKEYISKTTEHKWNVEIRKY